MDKDWNDCEGPDLVEKFTPLSDPMLIRTLDVAPSYVSRRPEEPRWVPTAVSGLLQCLFNYRPNCSVLFLDFDWLPPPDQPFDDSCGYGTRISTEAIGEPIVTDMTDSDHACVLSSHPELCDILYPTDFGALAGLTEAMLRIRDNNVGKGDDKSESFLAEATKQSDFLLKYGRKEVDATRGQIWGYTPLLHDFSNYSALVVKKRHIQERKAQKR
uniref:Uncharacterized protein n=1 Tax=Trieres chinensis TaxID=1514140 RepID=A0A7S2E859_TRICV|mmetsp:Transcript_12018/g.25052  ORF Transcript_12018/g.25052 Transcript_12018/m.25052 type:complete len:214 (+) Transcript_12018:935-1576(+)